MQLTDYNRVKGRLDAAQRDADRASGQLTQLMSQLKQSFSCGSIKEGEAALKKIKAEQAAAIAECEKHEAAFLAKFGKRIEDL